MKKTLLFLSIVVIGFSAFSQEGPKNVVKLNLGSLIYKTYSFQYERALTKNISVAGGLRFTPSIGLPKIVTKNDSTGDLALFEMKGWAITPEFRFYPGKKEEKQAPKGFYLAPYLRYAHFGMNIPVTFNDSISGQHTYEMTGKINAFSYGMMIGAQWLIKDRVSIDWWIMGVNFGSFKSTFEIEANLSGVPQQNRKDWENDIKETGENLPGGWTIDGKVYDNKVTASITGLLLGFRSGLCIGFAF